MRQLLIAVLALSLAAAPDAPGDELVIKVAQ